MTALKQACPDLSDSGREYAGLDQAEIALQVFVHQCYLPWAVTLG